MTASRPPLEYCQQVADLFAWLIDRGMDPPSRLDTEADMARTCEAYADFLAAEGVDADELEHAGRRLLARPVGGWGRRPWPDAGMVLDAVREARGRALPPAAMIQPFAMRLLDEWRRSGEFRFDGLELPERTANAVMEALIESGAPRWVGDPGSMWIAWTKAYNKRRGGS